MKKLILFMVLISTLIVPAFAFPSNLSYQYFSMDNADTSGSTAIDSANRLNGTLVNSPATGLSGIINEGYNFSALAGPDEYMTAGLFDLANDLAISAWINTTGEEGAIAAATGAGGGFNTFYFRVQAGGTLNLYLQDSSSGQTCNSAATVNNGTYVLVGFSYSSTGVGQIYVNGQASGATCTTVGDDDLSGGDTMYIGRHENGAFRYTGRVDEWSLWNKSLTAQQWDELYNSGAGINPFGGGGPPPATPGTVAFTRPLNLTNTSNNWMNWTLNYSNTSLMTNLSVELWRDGVFQNRSTTTTENPFGRNYTQLADGTYWLIGQGYEATGENKTNVTFTIDTTPPATVGNLLSINITRTTINWNWTNPADSDFNDSRLILNGTIQQWTTGTSYLASGLQCGKAYNLSINTRDTSGNINTTNVFNITQTSGCGLLGQGLELYYEFDDPAGGPYTDGSGNGYSGIATGSPLQTTGIQGFGLGLDGTADMFVNSTLNISNSSFTIQTWLNFDAFKSGRNDIYSFRDRTGAGMTMSFNSTGQGLQLNMTDTSGTVCQSGVFSNSNISTGRWYHVVLTFNGSIARTYLNGTLVNTSVSCPSSSFSDFFTLNRQYEGTGGGDEMDGTLDEVAVLGRLWAPNEVNDSYNNGVGRSLAYFLNGGIASSDILLTVGIPSNITVSFTYNETTGLITYTWNDVANQIDSAFFRTRIYNATGAFLHSVDSQNTTSGTLTRNITALLNNGWSVYAQAFINDSNRNYIFGDTVAVGTLFIKGADTIADIFPDDEGAMWSFFILITLMSFGVMLRSAGAFMILSTLGLALTSVIFLNVSIAFVGTAFVMAIIILWVVSKTR